jgi:hypothetical protein
VHRPPPADRLSRDQYRRLKDVTAREQIVRILQSLTDISAAELGRRVGVSRERVRQILKDLGYPTARGKGRPFGPVLVSMGGTPARHLSSAAATRIVAEDLLSRGYAIFAPVRTTKACDLIGVDGRGTVNLITIGTSGVSRKRLKMVRSKHFIVRRATVRPGDPVRYDPPIMATGKVVAES